MTFKDIVVHQGEDAHNDRRLVASLDLAKQFNARLTGVYVLTYPVVPGFVQTELPSEIIEQRYFEIRTDGESRRAEFDSAAAREAERRYPKCKVTNVKELSTSWLVTMECDT